MLRPVDHRLLLIPIALVLFAGACSGSDDSNAQPSDAATEQAGKGGKGGSGGSSTGGTDAGGTNAGGGTGGSTTTSCQSCATSECKIRIDACGADPQCATWLACAMKCSNAKCRSQCQGAGFATIAQSDLLRCLCTSCSTDAACGSSICTPTCVDSNPLAPTPVAPAKLSETGLYSDISTKTLAPYVKAYQPAYVLWSDDAQKERHVYLPACASVDTSDMDHWSLPVGTRFWKQFVRDGVLVETRMIHRFGPGDDDWLFATYQWQIDGNSTGVTGDALLVTDGVQNANGTPHDIPAVAQCTNCHGHLKERILSFSAIQLSHANPGETMGTLSKGGWLTKPNAAGYPVPGTDKQRAGLGYLHANCGNCHNDANQTTTLRLRLLTAQTTPESTDTYKTAVNVPTTGFDCLGIGIGTCDRIEPGDPNQSAIVMRMSTRGTAAQMPPIATEIIDPVGIDAVRGLIQTITP